MPSFRLLELRRLFSFFFSFFFFSFLCFFFSFFAFSPSSRLGRSGAALAGLASSPPPLPAGAAWSEAAGFVISGSERRRFSALRFSFGVVAAPVTVPDEELLESFGTSEDVILEGVKGRLKDGFDFEVPAM